MSATDGLLSVEQLRNQVEDGRVDTVLVAITDMQGRLPGKRCAARYFLNEVVPHAAEACSYLLAVDVDMNTVEGYAMSSWEDAWRSRYRDLQPANQYNADYSMIGSSRIEHLLRRIHNGMAGAGLYGESAKGECNLGQYEIAFRFAEALDQLGPRNFAV